MKKLIALAVVVCLVALGYSAAWLWAAGQASAYVKTLETADGVQVPRLVCGSFSIGGFPFGFDATCTDASVQSGDISVALSGLKASVEVYRPTHVLIFAQGPVAVADAFTGSQSRVDFASAEASARLDGWRIGRVSAVVEAPVWTDTVLGDRLLAQADRFEARLPELPDRHDGAAGLASLAIYSKTSGLGVPGLGFAGGEATLDAELANLGDDVRAYGDPDLLRRWQAAGARLTLNGLKGDAADFAFDASGSLGLDSAGRAEGQVQLHSQGVVERLGPLLPADVRGMVVGTPAADGSYSQTLTLAAGVVFSGLVPVGVVPPLF